MKYRHILPALEVYTYVCILCVVYVSVVCVCLCAWVCVGGVGVFACVQVYVCVNVHLCACSFT